MLTFKSCDFCEKDIPPGSALCPYCGRSQKTGVELRSYYRSVIATIVLSIGVLVIGAMLAGHR